MDDAELTAIRNDPQLDGTFLGTRGFVDNLASTCSRVAAILTVLYPNHRDDGMIHLLSQHFLLAGLTHGEINRMMPNEAEHLLLAEVRRRGLPLPTTEGEQPDDPALSKETQALAILLEHPDWTDIKIAKVVGCSRTSLYRWKKYKKARGIQEDEKVNLPRGKKSADGDLEAWD